MSEETDPAAGRRFRVHPLDLLWILLLIGLGSLAWAKLFRDSPLARPGDRLVGAELEVEFVVDRPWKEEFPAEGQSVLIEDALQATVKERRVSDAMGGARRIRLRLEVLGREAQRPETLTQYRRILRRGAVVVISEGESEVSTEVLEVRVPREAP